MGGNMTYRPGARLVKITTDPRVYAVSRYGVLRWVTSESLASSLYGPRWAQLVDDIPDVFFVNYTIGAPIMTSSDFNPSAEYNAVSNPGDTIPVSSSIPTVQPAPSPSSEGLYAHGSVRIINNSSQPQALIRTTRLMTSDNKIYRLNQSIVVPAYEHVMVEVYADAPGSEYAISPTQFIIPGLDASLQSMIYAVSDVTFSMRKPTLSTIQPQIVYPTPNLLLTSYPRILTIAWNGNSQRARAQIDMGGLTVSDRYWTMPYVYTTDNYQTSVQTEALAGDQWYRVHVQTLYEDGSFGPWSDYTYFHFQTNI
jgi:hypothetical protein